MCGVWQHQFWYRYQFWFSPSFQLSYFLFKSLKIYSLVPRIFSAWLTSKLMEEGWALQTAVVNKSINLGTTNAHRIGLALKIWSWYVISPMHCLTSLKIMVDLWCHPGCFTAACVCLLFLECPTLYSINFGLTYMSGFDWVRSKRTSWTLSANWRR